ncbi:MAG: asparagine synthetase B [Oligoflexia bacterium]|nr:asparagine synthetase B [Oligoflexia bacterium]
MSGLAGIWAKHSYPELDFILDKMSSALSHRGPDGQKNIIDQNFALAFQQMRVTPEEAHETQPLMDPNGLYLAFDGRIDNRESLLNLCGLSQGLQISDAELVLHCYKKWDEEFASKLVGEYAFSLFDKKKQKLFLARDVVGIRPLYYYIDNKHLVFASEIKALLTHPQIPKEPSDEGLAEFMLSNTRQDTSITCFKNIFAVEPAHMLIFESNSFRKKQYWDFDTQKTISFSNFEEYSQAFFDLYKKSVKRRMRSSYPIAVTVSGGLDSSTIFALAQLEGKNAIFGISFYQKDNPRADETAFLLELEKKYVAPIHRIEVSALAGIVQDANKVLYQAEVPSLDYTWQLTQKIFEAAKNNGARTLISGHWGDQLLFPQAYLVDLAKKFSYLKVKKHLGEFNQWYIGDKTDFLNKVFIKSLLRSYTPTPLVSPLRKLSKLIRGSPRDFLIFTKNFRHWQHPILYPWEKMSFASEHARETYSEIRKKHTLMSLDWNNKISTYFQIDQSFPMLDRDILDFIMAIPGEMINWGGVPRALLRNAMKNILPSGITNRKWKGDMTYPASEGLDKDMPLIINQLSHNTEIARQGFVNAQRLTKLMKQVKVLSRTPGYTPPWGVTELYALELWLRQYFEEKK